MARKSARIDSMASLCSQLLFAKSFDSLLCFLNDSLLYCTPIRKFSAFSSAVKTGLNLLMAAFDKAMDDKGQKLFDDGICVG